MPVDSMGDTARHRVPGAGFGGEPIQSLTGDTTKTNTEKLDILAREFESIFVNQMLKTMRGSIQKTGLIDGGNAEELYTQLMDEQLAREISFAQHDGLSSALVEQLTSMMNAEKQEENEKAK